LSQKHPKINNSECQLRLVVLRVSCLFLYGPICNVVLILDLSTEFASCFCIIFFVQHLFRLYYQHEASPIYKSNIIHYLPDMLKVLKGKRYKMVKKDRKLLQLYTAKSQYLLKRSNCRWDFVRAYTSIVTSLMPFFYSWILPVCTLKYEISKYDINQVI